MPAEPDHSDNSEHAARRVLIVDDDRVALILFSHIARQSGWHVTEADDLQTARHAVHAAASNGKPFEVVVSDYELPDGSGLDLFDEVQTMDAGSRFVLVTGHQERDEFSDERVDHVDRFLVKPVASQDLAEALGTPVAP